jgi:hypothetical protein
MKFFTMFHTPGEGGAANLNGVGPINNQPACIGCHLNAAEAVKSKGLLQGQGLRHSRRQLHQPIECHARGALDADELPVHLAQ